MTVRVCRICVFYQFLSVFLQKDTRIGYDIVRVPDTGYENIGNRPDQGDSIMTDMLAGKVALVTGGASGIGQAVALAMAQAGATIVLADVQVDLGEATRQQIEANGGTALFVQADISRSADVTALIQQTVATYGRLDCAFNNAGIVSMPGPMHECTDEDWDRVMATNLKGTWFCMKYEIQQMLRQGGGVIVNTTSAVSEVGLAGMASYVASKHGVLGLTRTAAVEYATAGIRVNAIGPGATRTPLLNWVIGGNPEVEAQITALAPMERLGLPDELAGAVIWLCSDAASFVTGQNIIVDGGMLAR
jgi:NAD(P)-dependent dehydrogenase (short-subunit alcohol dehydrogenase family)